MPSKNVRWMLDLDEVKTFCLNFLTLNGFTSNHWQPVSFAVLMFRD